MKRYVWSVAVVVVSMLPAASASVTEMSAAESLPAVSAGPTVSGTGVGSANLQAQVLRLGMQIGAAGADTQTALDTLLARQEKVRAKLVELGATAESIKFTGMSVSSGPDDRQRAMQRMIMSRLHNRGGSAPASQPAGPTRATLSVKAEWPIASLEPRKMLELAADITKKLKAEDYSGKKDAEKLSAADQEALEEAEDSANQYMGEDENDGQAEPVLFFVGKVSKDDRAAATAQAFAKAKESAEQLAAAAGAKLGTIRNLSVPGYGLPDMTDAQMMYGGPRSYRTIQRLMQAREDGSAEIESMAMDPTSLKYRTAVTATFVLLP